MNASGSGDIKPPDLCSIIFKGALLIVREI